MAVLSLPRTKRPRRPASRLQLRQLEDRTVPALVTWDGGGGDFNWNNPLNWSSDVLPGTADDVVIDYGANDFTVTYSGGYTFVNSLACQATLLVSSGTFATGGGTSSGSFQVAAGATLGLGGQTLTATSSVTGDGSVVISGARSGGCTISPGGPRSRPTAGWWTSPGRSPASART